MIRRELPSFLCATIAAAGSLANAAPTPSKPNVLLILTDDQGWADIGYNNPAVYTPHLDKLANEGLKFANSYAMPQCTPTRVALMTGRYPGRFGPQALVANSVPAFPKGTPTVATMFKECGYTTFLCGKWHLGSNPDHGPNDFGFDQSYGSLGGAVGMYDHRYRRGPEQQTWHRNHKPIADNENGVHATDLTAREAVRFINRKRDQPFFLYLAFHAVHTPLDERGEFVDQPTRKDPPIPGRWLNEDKIRWFNDPQGRIQREKDPEKRLLLAAAYHLDDAVGQVIAALEQSGQRDHTLILFSSDNGPQTDWPGNSYPDDLNLTDFNQRLPMRGVKCDVWEGGIHVPGFANWPGQIKKGTLDTLVHVIDWLPTLAGLLAYQPVQPMAWDGIDLGPAMFHGQPLPPRDLYWIWNQQPNRWALRHGEWKIVKYGQQEPANVSAWQLFNLTDDPMERNDVASQQPQMVATLHQKFLAQRSKDLKKTARTKP